jgi:serine/threonine-protein kinase
MLAKRLLGVCASLTLAASACGSSQVSSGATGGPGATGTGATGTGATGTSATGTGATGTGATSTGGTGTGATGTGGTGTTTTGTSGPLTTCAGNVWVGSLFSAQEPWNTPVDQDPKDPGSDTIINWLSANGGWGNGNVLQIDTSINIQCADATTPMKPFTLSMGSCSPDCDSVSTFPVPPGGAVEGESGYACNGGGDCHLLVVDRANSKLYEMYQAFYPADPNVFNSGGGAMVWDLTKAYPPNLRGDGCTSADAGGFPIAAMLFTADEVAAGHIDHAIRFILPNSRIRDGASYVHPASHAGVNVKSLTRPDAPPYGVHFRLKSTVDLTKLPSDGARVVAKAMQKYGMFLADGGSIALTATDDQFTKAKWSDADVNVDPKALSSIKVTDFEVVNLGSLFTGDNCVRNP